MRADFIIHEDRRFKKPFTILSVIHDDLNEVSSSADINGRFSTPSEARAEALKWVHVDSYEIKWGKTVLTNDPPAIITEEAQ